MNETYILIFIENRKEFGVVTYKFRHIENLKCYYNLYTNENFELRSVIFSDLKKSHSVKFKDKHASFTPKDYTEIERKIVKKTINFENIFENHAKIKDMVKLSASKADNVLKESNILLQNKNINLNYCNNKKSKCLNCKSSCMYSLHQIETLKSKELKFELKRHGHPTSRIIDKVNRNISQEKSELYEHYLIRHDLK